MASDVSFGIAILAFLAVSAAITLLIKKFTKADTYYIISLIRTQRPLAFFDRMARHSRFLDVFASLGLVLGFGALAVDFLYGRKMPVYRRIALFVVSFASLSSLIYAADSAFGNFLSRSVLVGTAFPVVVASFGLLGLSGFTLLAMLLQAYDIVAKYMIGSRSCPGVAPLVPGVEIPGVPITPPLHAWISLLIILVAHEGMHGILGRRHGFRIKSTGVLLLGFLPIGAFVEPEESELKREPVDEKVLSFLSAGPMANIALMVVAGIVLMGVASAFAPLTERLYPGIQDNLFSGVKVAGVLEQGSFCGSVYPSPAFGVLMEGDIIKKIGGMEVKGLKDFFALVQGDRFSEKAFTVERGGKEFDVALAPNAMGQFGVRLEAMRNTSLEIPGSFYYYGFAFSFVADFLYWLLLLNFLVASINFLPMHPFDGGRIAKIIFAPYFAFLKMSKEDTQRVIEKALLIAVLALILINALPLFV